MLFLHRTANVGVVLGAAWAAMGIVGVCAAKYTAPRMSGGDHIIWFVLWPYFLGYIVPEALGHGASGGSSGSSVGAFDFDVYIEVE